MSVPSFQTAPSDSALRVADLGQNAVTAFALRPDAQELAALAQELAFSTLRKVSFEGSLRPYGASGWSLTGRLGATVVQPCVITLEPVTTRIDTDVTRHFLADFEDPEEAEVEMAPEDDISEPLGPWIDPAQVLREALTLAAPDYPRKDDAALGQMVYTKPGEVPMRDEDARPFAGLADLKAQLEKDAKDSD